MAENGIKPITGNELTPKQEAFCLAYVENGSNATKACADAGYSNESEGSLAVEGSRLLRNAKICERINQIRANLGQKGIVNTEYIATNLVEITERCMESRMATDREGEPLGFFTFNPKEAINALKVLAVMNGDMVNKVEAKNLNANIDVPDSEALDYLSELGLLPEGEIADSETPIDISPNPETTE